MLLYSYRFLIFKIRMIFNAEDKWSMESVNSKHDVIRYQVKFFTHFFVSQLLFTRLNSVLVNVIHAENKN